MLRFLFCYKKERIAVLPFYQAASRLVLGSLVAILVAIIVGRRLLR